MRETSLNKQDRFPVNYLLVQVPYCSYISLRRILKAVDTVGNITQKIVSIKPYLVTSNGERFIV